MFGGSEADMGGAAGAGEVPQEARIERAGINRKRCFIIWYLEVKQVLWGAKGF
jgi:hypothetical protein